MSEKQEVKFSEKQLLNLYGLLFKVSYVDGGLDKDELRKIFEFMNTEDFSEQGKIVIQNFLVEEPNIEKIIRDIKMDINRGIEGIEYIAYLNAIEISICNDEINTAQQELLARLKKEFIITYEQDKEMRKFAQKAKEIADRGIDDAYAKDALKGAVAGLGGVGVPLVAVYFSGGVIGLSAAGITSGLAAVGLGFGMVPGIGVAIAIGTVIFMIVKELLDIGGKNQEKKIRLERERRAEQVIRNLQDTINRLIDEISELEKKAQDAVANREAIHKFQEIIRNLRQIQNAKKQGYAAC